MEEELELDLEENKVEKRIKNLSDKVKTTSEERDAKTKLAEEAEIAKTNAEKERDFYKGFNQVSTKHPNATEYQDKIWEKVKAGYELEDATISILAKEGKYTQVETPVQRESAAGGSAATAMAGMGQKSLSEMSKAEKREALNELESKGEFKF